jgi:hypothetical protein
VSIVTKSVLIERDMDLLAKAAKQYFVHLAISDTILDRRLSRRMRDTGLFADLIARRSGSLING